MWKKLFAWVYKHREQVAEIAIPIVKKIKDRKKS